MSSSLRTFMVIILICGTSTLYAQNSLALHACDDLQGQSVPAENIGLPTTGATVTQAMLIKASAQDNRNGEYCQVNGAIHPVSTTAPDIKFQVNLPTDWNGKSLHFGGGGLNGRLITGLNVYTKQPQGEDTALARGYVTFGSDSGHQSQSGFDGTFYLNDEALLNFGHQQLKKTRDVAHQLIQARYSKGADKAYFIGGSQGGHEAFDVVQRFPEDYDGVVAAYPAHNFVMLQLSANNYARALHANGGESWMNPAKVEYFTTAVYKVCDGLDNAEDGIISNVPACQEATAGFRLYSAQNPIRCLDGRDTGDACLSDAQIQFLNAIDAPYNLGFSIYPDDKGNTTYPKWTPFEGSTFTDGGFPHFGADGPGQAFQFGPGEVTPRYAVTRDLNMNMITEFNTADWAGRITQLGDIMSANRVNIDKFQNRGGKLIIYHGMVDDFITVYSSIEYYQRLLNRYGEDELGDFVRFYTIPGFGHVTGPFSARISSLDYLEDWVEQGEAPAELLAVDANKETAGRTRPVCHYPEWPRYRGRGDINSADNFRCVEE